MKQKLIVTIFLAGLLILALALTAQAATITIYETIVVKRGETYDGQGNTIKAVGMGDGSQDEDQEPIFKLENGANLKNVRIAAPGCDGVHVYGNNTITNVVWEDVGEDALTVKGEGTVTINGGSAAKASDKVFQINKPCTFTVKNFSANGMGKFIRQNGGSTFTVTIYLDTLTLNDIDEAIVRTDSSSTRVYYRNLKVTNFNGSKGWWYGRDSQASPY